MIRAGKSAFVAAFGLLVTIFALNNIVNFDIALTHVAYVVGQTEHAVYPKGLVPVLGGDAIVTAILCLIIAAELAAGVTLLKGGFDMARALGGPAEAFEEAKSTALLGCLLAIGVWFGLFVLVGGGFYQMWQTGLGRGSFNDSSTMVIFAGLVFLITRSPDK